MVPCLKATGFIGEGLHCNDLTRELSKAQILDIEFFVVRNDPLGLLIGRQARLRTFELLANLFRAPVERIAELLDPKLA